ncbi:hypothetical protein P170DRAFT_369815 [Aspergillus steynii IBT 23096]|uniref:NACHT domain-containing protein n=1 Tax=Aspergillus steynii IBT 23096 TaxID=1392250 RepID=A0A2I2FRQ9_9EURO|nr:uncharacterized protein P170DRAFT_369815 [Aspergillus steynii IBT 23096]PLB43320.1 hypothetical protein P170DRAFT_369815 [Aspergillus steynii IBT 23096]
MGRGRDWLKKQLNKQRKSDRDDSDRPHRSSLASTFSTGNRNSEPLIAQADPIETSDKQIDANELTKEHNALWNEAYEAIKNDKEKAKYLDSYERIAARLYLGHDGENGLHQNRDVRERQMKEMVRRGLERVQKAKRFTERYESVFDFTRPFKAILDAPLKNIPQTALPWGVVSSSLDVGILFNTDRETQILAQPGKTNATLYSGVTYTVSRIDWYSQFTDKVLSDNAVRDKLLETARSGLRAEILDVYQSLLFYQMKSICFYHKNQVTAFVRGLVDLDKWSDDLAAIKTAEEALQRDIDQYNSESLKSRVAESQSSSTQRSIEQEKQDNECIKLLCGTDPRSDIDSIQSRKDDLIKDSYKWILDTNEYQKFIDWEDPEASLLWISGQAGTGKTMLLIGIIKELSLQGRLELDCPELLYFFCQDGNKDTNNSVAVLKGIIWLLIIQQPELTEYPREVYQQSAGKHLTDGNVFITLRNMLRKMLDDPRLGRIFLVIDALDECSDASRKELINFIYQEACVSGRNRNVRWLVSSRPLPDVYRIIRPSGQTVGRIDVNDYILKEPIHAYIDKKALELKSVTDNEARLAEISEQLKEKASNTFIWVSLVIRELKDADSHHWTKILGQLPRDLEDLYRKLLGQLAQISAKNECQRVLTAVLLARRPLNLAELEVIVAMEAEATLNVVRQCRSFLTIQGKRIHILHQSAREYLSSHYRELGDVSMGTLNSDICRNSLEGMKGLKRDIYNLLDPGVAIEDISTPDPDLLYPLSYACQHWVYHLSHSKFDTITPGEVLSFLKVHLLHWFEAMSLLRILPDTINMMRILEEVLQDFPDPLDFIRDAHRFIRKSMSAISAAPLQVYVSALVFAPKKSSVRCIFWHKERPVWMHRFPEVSEYWNAALQTLEHPSWVDSVLFSPDGRFIAADYCREIRIWDASTGALVQILEDTTPNEFLAFSPDSKMLALGLEDSTIIIRGTDEWEIRQTLQGPDKLTNGAFSPNGQLMLSASESGLIFIWDTCEWVIQQTMRGPEEPLRVAFSANSKLIAFTSARSTGVLEIWNIETGQFERRLEAHAHVLLATFPTDGFLWTVGDGNVKVWDTETWEWDLKMTLDPGAGLATISSDHRYLATHKGTVICVWNMITGKLEGSFQANYTTFMVFSPNNRVLATGTRFGHVRLWDMDSGGFETNISTDRPPIFIVALSPNKQWAASCSWERNPTFYNATTGRQIHRPPGQSANIVHMIFSPNSQILATASWDNTVKLWSTESGDLLQTLEGNSGGSRSRCKIGFAENCLHVTLDGGQPRIFNVNAGIETGVPEPQIGIEDSWVSDKCTGRRLICLPSDCQPGIPRAWAAQDKMVVIGTRDGTLLFMEFERM